MTKSASSTPLKPKFSDDIVVSRIQSFFFADALQRSPVTGHKGPCVLKDPTEEGALCSYPYTLAASFGRQTNPYPTTPDS